MGRPYVSSTLVPSLPLPAGMELCGVEQTIDLACQRIPTSQGETHTFWQVSFEHR